MTLKLIQGKQIDVNLTGSFSGSFTGNLVGTSSWASNAISSSVSVSSSFAATASYAVSSSRSVSSSFAISASQAISSSFATSASYSPVRDRIQSGSVSAIISPNNGLVISAPTNIQGELIQGGSDLLATGLFSHAEGSANAAVGLVSHAEGGLTIASGAYSHTEGFVNTTIGVGSHAEGTSTTASGDYSHTEGSSTVASGSYSHAEGLGHYQVPGTEVQLANAFSIDFTTDIDIVGGGALNPENSTQLIFSGDYSGTSFPQIVRTLLIDYTVNVNFEVYPQVELVDVQFDSVNTIMTFTGLQEAYSTILGKNYAIGVASHVEGLGTNAIGEGSHAEGFNTVTSGSYSHAEGYNSTATGEASHAEGYQTLSTGLYSHAEGAQTTASGSYSHAEGQQTYAIGQSSHAEGSNAQAIGEASHAEGYQVVSSGSYSHAEGQSTTSIGIGSHAEGASTTARGNVSHAEGILTQAAAAASHAEGFGTVASGSYSHAEGQSTTSIGIGSHAEGLSTVASGPYQHVQGQFNISSSAQSAFIVGNGVADNARSNLVFASGSQFQVTGSVTVTQGITGSLEGTSSFAVSASWAPSQAVDTSAFVTTSSFNAFTSSYSTGSFTGSFVGSLEGTSSWATNSVSASYFSGNISLDQLSDVSASVPQNGEVITYNSSSELWETQENILLQTKRMYNSYRASPNSIMVIGATTGYNLGTGQTGRILTGSSNYERSQRVGILTLTGSNQSTTYRNATLHFSLDGLEYFEQTFGNAEGQTVTGVRALHGISTNVGLNTGNIEYNTVTDFIGVCRLSTSNNWHVLHNDNAGLATTIDLGSNFPANVTQETFTYRITPKGTNNVDLTFTRNSTGAKVTTNITTNIPSTAALYTGKGALNNNTSTVIVGFDFFAVTELFK
jgi:hypothetical protein